MNMLFAAAGLLLLGQSTGAVLDVTRAPVATTNVAVKVGLDSEGRVTTCSAPTGTPEACKGFTKGRVVAAPIRRNGKPVRGVMTVSTTTVVSAAD